MPPRTKGEKAEVIRAILEAIDLGARTGPEIAEIAGVNLSTVHYHLVRKRGTKNSRTLCQQGLVRAITKHAASRREGQAGEIFREYILTAKGERYLQES